MTNFSSRNECFTKKHTLCFLPDKNFYKKLKINSNKNGWKYR